jgi:hypothetical protein
LFEAFYEKINEMKDAGIVNHLDKTQLTKVLEYKSSNLPTMNKLSGLYIWIIVTAFAFVGLWFEVLKVWLPMIKDSAGFTIIVNAFYDYLMLPH